MSEPQSRAPDAIARNKGDRADEVIGRALKHADELVSVLQAVADTDGIRKVGTLGFIQVCPFECTEAAWMLGDRMPVLHHTLTCPVTKARALLGKEQV